MSVELYCQHHLYGHCKFGNTCKKFHVKVTCDSFPCLLEGCSSRHPQPCKFFSLFGKCKFSGNCSFLHIPSTNQKLIEALKEIESLKNEIGHLKTTLLKSILAKIDRVENNLEEFKTLLSSEKPNIRMYSCELCDFKSEREIDLEDHTKRNHESNTDVPVDVTFKCDLCDYKSGSKKGVNIHRGSKHKRLVSTPAISKDSIPVEATSASSSKPSVESSVPCSRECFGCTNEVFEYSDTDTALCTPCKNMLEIKSNFSPFCPTLCPSCHDPSEDGTPFSFCPECLKLLEEDGCLDSCFGTWFRDKITGEKVCINLDFEIP